MGSIPSFITFGEIMLRLTPENKYERLVKTNALKMDFAGAESNVAIALSIWNNDVNFISVLPENDLGDGALHLLQEFGVGTEDIIRGGGRIGIYFIEDGASIRPSKVLYDRQFSSISALRTGKIDWKAVFQGKTHLHLTGITPALSLSCSEETIKAAFVASSMGIKVSFDMNYRRTLWKSREEAESIFDAILEDTFLLIANEGALNDVYNLKSTKETEEERCMELMSLLMEKYALKYVAFTMRKNISASINEWQGIIYDGKNYALSARYQLEIVDRFGGGDAFAAGILHGLGKEWNLNKMIQYATAASALQQTVPGDLCLVSEDEIFSAMEGNVSGHVQR